jgi:hypothetical protein
MIGEALGQHGAEEGKFPNAVAAAQRGDLRGGDLDMCNRHASSMTHP